MPYRGSFAALPALVRRWVVGSSWSNATRDGSDSSSGFRVRTPASSADFGSFAGRRCGLGAHLYSADGSDLESVSPAILIGLDLSARRRNRGARVKPLCRRMTGLGETSPTTIAPSKASHRLRMRLPAVPALVDFAAERRKRRAHERACNAATFGGCCAFLRPVSQPQNEDFAAGVQCTSLIWVMDSISLSSLPAGVNSVGANESPAPANFPTHHWGAGRRRQSPRH